MRFLGSIPSGSSEADPRASVASRLSRWPVVEGDTELRRRAVSGGLTSGREGCRCVRMVDRSEYLEIASPVRSRVVPRGVSF